MSTNISCYFSWLSRPQFFSLDGGPLSISSNLFKSCQPVGVNRAATSGQAHLSTARKQNMLKMTCMCCQDLVWIFWRIPLARYWHCVVCWFLSVSWFIFNITSLWLHHTVSAFSVSLDDDDACSLKNFQITPITKYMTTVKKCTVPSPKNHSLRPTCRLQDQNACDILLAHRRISGGTRLLQNVVQDSYKTCVFFIFVLSHFASIIASLESYS